MTLEAIITLSIAVLALGMKPGPGMMMVMSRTISGGMSACFAFLVGFLTMTFVYLVLVFFSFQYVNLDLIFISILIKSVAAVYLIYVGSKGILYPDVSYGFEEPQGHSFFDNLSSAFILTASNPLVIVFYAGILPTIIDVNLISMEDIIVITSVVLILEGGLVILYCLPFAMFRKKIPTDFLKGLRIFSSIVIILIGLYIGYTALPSMDLTSVFG
jgi:threonine/homoserine/homoserine lactone efflux protein